MSKKIEKIIKISIFIIIVVYALKTTLPEYLKQSEIKELWNQSQNYQSMIEIKINHTIDLGMIIDKNKRVYHLYFFTKDSLIFQEQKIEKETLEEALKKILELATQKKYLTKSSSLEIICYNKTDIVGKIEEWQDEYLNFSLTYKTLAEKAQELGINSTKKNWILWGMELYSQSIIETTPMTFTQEISYEEAQIWSKNIYQKLEDYIAKNQLTDFTKEEAPLYIQLIPADENGKYYANEHSWYSLTNHQLNAYIEFTLPNSSFSFCYHGSLEKVTEEC